MGRFNKAEWFAAKNFTVGHRGHTVRAIVIHIMEGKGEATVKNWLNQSGVSWHFSVCENGKTYQHVDTSNSAWANGIWWDSNIGWFRTAAPQNRDLRPYRSRMWKGLITTGLAASRNPNFYTISIENGGYTGRAFSQEQFVSNVDVCEYIAREQGWTKLVVGENLIGHRDIDPVNRAFCPGTGIDLDALARAVNERLSPPPVIVNVPPIGEKPAIGEYDILASTINVREGPFTTSKVITTFGTQPTDPSRITAIDAVTGTNVKVGDIETNWWLVFDLGFGKRFISAHPAYVRPVKAVEAPKPEPIAEVPVDRVVYKAPTTMTLEAFRAFLTRNGSTLSEADSAFLYEYFTRMSVDAAFFAALATVNNGGPGKLGHMDLLTWVTFTSNVMMESIPQKRYTVREILANQPDKIAPVLEHMFWMEKA